MKKYLIFLTLICFTATADLDIPVTLTGTGPDGIRVEKTLEEIKESPDALFLVRIDVHIENQFTKRPRKKPDFDYFSEEKNLQEALQDHRSKIKEAIKASGIKKFLVLSADPHQINQNNKIYSASDSRYPNLIDYYKFDVSYKGKVSIYILTPDFPTSSSSLTYVTFTEIVALEVNSSRVYISSPKKALTSFPNSIKLPSVNMVSFIKSLSPKAIELLNNTHQRTKHQFSSNLEKKPAIDVVFYDTAVRPVYFSGKVDSSKIKSRAQFLKAKTFCMKLIQYFTKGTNK